MSTQPVLLIHENVRSARFIQHLLEEAGYAVDWKPHLTPAILRSHAMPHAVILDLHFLDLEDQSKLRSMCEHPRWKSVPVLVTAGILYRHARRMLLRIGAADVMLRPRNPSDGKELLIRLHGLLSDLDTAPVQAPSALVQGSSHPTSLAEIETLAGAHVSVVNVEAILVQLLRTFRQTASFDVGFVCAETEPDRYMVVAHLGDDSFVTAQWYEPGMSLTGWIVLHKRALLISDMESEPRVRMVGRELGANRNFRSFLGVPLMYEGHVLGTMEAASYRSDAFGHRSATALQHIAHVASMALGQRQTRHELAQQVLERFHATEQDAFPGIAGESPAMRALLRTASRVRESQTPVLITGSTGSGKEMLARYLHATSSRRARAFVAVSCPAIADSFASQELFGVAGGLHPEVQESVGSVEQAEGGTLLLDEIGRASIPLQSKLLRLLDQRSFCRSGAHNPQPFTGRILATTSLDLNTAMAEGKFLPDLYHRLAAVTLALPPLRDRTQDIVPLFQHFARQFAAEYDVPVPSLPPEWVDQMTEYAWPGNIRELRNAVERCMLQHDGKQLVFGEGQQDLQAAPSMMSMAMERRWSAPELQSRYARFVYEQVNHNKAQACRILQINYRTLCNHLRASPDVVDASAVAV